MDDREPGIVYWLNGWGNALFAQERVSGGSKKPAMKNTRAGGRGSGYEGRMLKGRIRTQAMRDCLNLEGKLIKEQGVRFDCRGQALEHRVGGVTEA
jgi:hypothetical protein